MKRHLQIFSVLLAIFVSSTALSQIPSAPEPQAASISGYVVDTDGAAIPHASVNAKGISQDDQHAMTADDVGFFRMQGLKAGVSYAVSVVAKGFGTTTVTTTALTPGGDLAVAGLTLKPAADMTVAAESEQEIATEEVKQETQQRLFGFLPNFYVVYDRTDEVPLSAKLKFKLAFKATFDFATLGASVFVAGIDQAAHYPAYVEGARGFGQRVGDNYASAGSDILIGGAILPALLHQDPRYYYQGTGTKKSRLWHALSSPILCKGDNGHTQFNISSIGGDLASGAISQTYTPARDRGFGSFISGALIVTGGREVNTLLQEFVYAKFTTRGKKKP